ncbi:MAG: GNAT family N-acetyltransferase [Gemmataceae bacterium]
MERVSTTLDVRSFLPGDDVAQVSLYNEAAAGLPRFKPATLDEARRRLRDPGFDPATRLYAIEKGRPVGYVTFHPSGRVSHPWCRKGREELAGPLFDRALDALRARGVRKAFAAYRADWEPVREFFAARGFTQAREMINYVLDLVEMPTPAARTTSPITPLTPADLPAALELGRGVLRAADVESLRRHLFDNLYFPPSSVFALRQKPDGPPLAVGVLVTSAAFADPNGLDANMPCYRLGAFGAEGMTHKRVNGLFSVLAADDRDLLPITLDLLGHANRKLEDTDVGTFAAQVPSDATHLVRFYKSLFRRQGSFPVYERPL